jgi:serine/threonine protein kinase
MNCPFCQAANEAGDSACFSCGHTLATATMIRRGSLIASRYEILNPLGRGGMGMVYKAQDRALDDVVALKILRGEIAGTSEVARRFRQEIKLARKVRHRNTCGIHEYGEDGALRYLVMELIDGVDLRQVIRNGGGLSPRDAFDYAIQVAEGLAAIHDAGIIHRDLKSANLMRDERGLVRLMDFGIAKEWEADVTATSQILGTPEYLSPEQARGERVDPRTDIYSLGVVLFELFTGDVPFRGDTALATAFKHVHEPAPLEGPRVAAVPPAVLPILRKTLAKEPALRYGSVLELLDALRRAASVVLADGGPMPAAGYTPAPVKRYDRTMSTTAAMSLGGDLRTMPFVDVLQWLDAGQKSGTLQLEGRSVEKRIAFRSGRLFSSWSNDPRESLGQFLVRDGRISEEELFKALLKQEDQGRLLGAVLVADGLLTEEGLRGSMQAKAEECVYELFLWTEGRFQFREGDVPANSPINLDMPLVDVIAQGVRRRDEWTRIRAKIPAGPVVFRVRGDPAEVDDPGLRQILDLAGQGKAPAEIGLHTRRSEFDIASGLFELCQRWLLEIEHVGDDVPADETLSAIGELLEIGELRLKEGRYEPALDAYEAVLQLDRLNQTAKKGLIAVIEARHRDRARRTVPLTKVPALRSEVSVQKLQGLDPQEGFMLSRINGEWTVQQILKVCPMAEEDALLVLARLADRKMIVLR